MKSLLVLVDQLSDWSPYYPSRQVVDIAHYLQHAAQDQGYIINLCRDFTYLSSGYYGSLLAEARGGMAFPNARAIRELHSFESGQPLLPKHSRLLESYSRRHLKNVTQIEIRSYFGTSAHTELAAIMRRIFETYAFPVLDIVLTKVQSDFWVIHQLDVPALDQLHEKEQDAFAAALDAFSHKMWRTRKASKGYKYDVAILVNPDEALPPSNKGALQAFVQAGKQMGLNMDFIHPTDASRIGEYDALFIRETTRVDHHTYRMAQLAENQGLVVIDSTRDIMRCSNKVYLHETLQRHKVDTPATELILTQQPQDIEHLVATLGLPVIVKVPDGSFSIGVEKASTRDELAECIARLGERSALLLLQEFVPTEFDWRIGILDGQVLYACRYFMARSHWQIYNHGARSHKSGDADAFSPDNIPKHVLRTAKKAAKCMGDGFYGVDIKDLGDKAVIIEVNDNPSIDKGVEDLHSGSMLYQQIMGVFLKRLDEMNGR